MNEQVLKYIAPVKNFWGKQSKKRKIAMISVLAGIVVVAVVIVALLNMKPYVTLYSGLAQEEAIEVMNALQTKGVDYKTQGAGTTILVEKEKEPLIRMQLATEGHPRTAPDYSMVQNNVNMLTTDAERRTYNNFQDQERMQETIRTITGVESAIVTIVQPQDDGYVWEEAKGKASASATIKMKQGYELTPAQVTGIKRVVATSVGGLALDDIAVVDSNTGEELAASDKMTYVDIATFKRDIEKKFQTDLEKNAERILIPAYGKDNVTAVAKLSMNFDEKLKEVITYTPSDEDTKNGMLESATKNQEKVTGKDAAGGVVGSETNADLPNYVGLTDDGNSIYFKDGTQYNYLVNKATEQITAKTPVTEDTTIAVTVNRKIVELSAAEIDDLTRSVANATGVLPTKVSIFNTEYLDSTIPGVDAKPGILDNKVLVISMSAAALLLLIGMVVVIIISSKIKKKKKAAEVAAAVNADLEELTRLQGEALPNMMEDLKNVPESKEQALKKEIQDFTQNNPEIVAQLLRTWLKGDDADA